MREAIAVKVENNFDSIPQTTAILPKGAFILQVLANEGATLPLKSGKDFFFEVSLKQARQNDGNDAAIQIATPEDIKALYVDLLNREIETLRERSNSQPNSFALSSRIRNKEKIVNEIVAGSLPFVIPSDSKFLSFNDPKQTLSNRTVTSELRAEYDIKGYMIVISIGNGILKPLNKKLLEDILQPLANSLAHDPDPAFIEAAILDWENFDRHLKKAQEQAIIKPALLPYITEKQLKSILDTTTDLSVSALRITLNQGQKGLELSQSTSLKALSEGHKGLVRLNELLTEADLPTKLSTAFDASKSASKNLWDVLQSDNELTSEQKKSTRNLVLALIAMTNNAMAKIDTNNVIDPRPTPTETSQSITMPQVKKAPDLKNNRYEAQNVPIAPRAAPTMTIAHVQWELNRYNAPEEAVKIRRQSNPSATTALKSSSSKPSWNFNSSSTTNDKTELALRPTRQGAPNPSLASTGLNHSMPSYYYMSREEVEQFVEATIGMPAELTKAIIRIESKGNQYAYNDDYYSRRQGRFVNGTYACGYMQLMPRGSYTYQEMMWNYGDALGINRIFGVESLRNTVVKEAPIGKNSDGSNKIGYTFTDEYVVAALNNCFNPYINITLGAMHMVQKVGISEAAMIEKHAEGFESFPYVFGYLHHFLGARPDLINAYFHTPDALAKEFVERGVVTRNRAMFYDSSENPRTVKGMFEYMKTTGKMSDLKITDPNQFFWRQSVNDINLKVQGQIKDAQYMVAVPTTATSIANGGSARLALAAP